MKLEVRAMTHADAEACIAIFNPIIAKGGSTAHEDAYDIPGFVAEYCDAPEIANVVLADGRIVGFQAAFTVEPGVYSIGSFTDQINPVRGAGAAIMAQTKADCKDAGGTSIIAKITSDNTGGLAYYSKMGFVDEAVWPGEFTRKNGQTVDRVIKRFQL